MSVEIAWNLVAIVALGMALSVCIADFRSRSSLLLALLFVLLGVTVAIEGTFIVGAGMGEIPTWVHWTALADMGALLGLSAWLRVIRRTAQLSAQDERGSRQIRFSHYAAIVYGAVSMAFPHWRLYIMTTLGEDPGTVLQSPTFYAIALPFVFSIFFFYLAMLRTLLLQPDPPERMRLLGFCVALPLFLLALFVPREIAPYFAIIGEMALLVAVMQYHVQWGQRGHFMSRFLSPQVAAVVRERGLDEAIHEDRLELTAVACDIRGFSRYAENHDSAEVIALIGTYYRTVGEVAAKHGATIKDYAGDGVLLLVGAPLANPNHAQDALKLAADLRHHCQPLWYGSDLDLGVGVASGQVSVGIVGTSPMEYAAVGRAVNLASRLCEHADGGEILVSNRTVELLGGAGEQFAPHSERAVQFKGLAEPVSVWKLKMPDRVTGPRGGVARKRWFRRQPQKA